MDYSTGLATALKPRNVAKKLTKQASAQSKLNKQGRPVESLAGVSNVLKPQYAALRDEVSAQYPVTQLSPEVKGLMAKAGQVTADMLAGNISPDVQAQVQRISAENAIRGGLGMSSQASRNLTARDLGQTSMDIQMKGIESAKALGEFDAGLMGQRMDFMTKMRGLDLEGAQMQVQNRQFNKELQLNRFKLLSDNLMSYYQLSFGFENTKNANKTSSASLRRDNEALLADMRSRWGLK